jgi:hypothetical protein
MLVLILNKKMLSANKENKCRFYFSILFMEKKENCV